MNLPSYEQKRECAEKETSRKLYHNIIYLLFIYYLLNIYLFIYSNIFYREFVIMVT